VLDIVALDRLDAALALPPEAPLLIDGTMQRFGSERVEAFLPREMRAAD
jgi:hypothetical protein